MNKYKKDTEHTGLEVKSIQENADSFNTTGLKYCHYFTLRDPDGGYELLTQVCTDQPTQNFCSVGDIVDVKIKHYHEKTQVFTLYYIRTDQPGKTFTGPMVKNSVISGSAAAVALSESIKYHVGSNMPFTDTSVDQVLVTANKMFDWLIDKNKGR